MLYIDYLCVIKRYTNIQLHMEPKDLLQKLGLNEKESLVYTALVERGPSTVSAIARTCGLYRPQIYAVIPLLQNKGLITLFPKGKQRRYVAENPAKLQSMLEATTQDLGRAMGVLEALYNAQGGRPIIKYLEGPQGLKMVLTDLLHTMKRGETYYRVTSVHSYDSLRQYLPENYTRQRNAKQLERYIITNENIAGQTKNLLDRAVKAIPPESALLEHDINVIIYGPKVAFIDYRTETAMIIESQTIADLQRELFLLLYKRL